MGNIVLAMADFWNAKREQEIVFPPFYDALINSLRENGNNVQVYINPVYKYSFQNDIPKNILNDLLSFKPDLFILFNNNFWDITKYFDCPIIIYDVDSPNAYANLELLKEKKSRFKFVVQQKDGIDWTSEAIGIDKNKIEYILPFTKIKRQEMKKTRNISFIGSIWLWDGCRDILDFQKQQPNDNDIEFARMCIDELTKNPMKPIEEIYEELINQNLYTPENKIILSDQRTFIGRYSGIKRAKILQEIADLGLIIHGSYWVQNSLCYFPDLALRYSHTPVCSTEEHQYILNQSKIAIQIGHIQAQSGFSWKVLDIMASDACILTNYSSDLKQLSKNIINLPMYTSKQEARDLCIDLLKNENKRKEIIIASNEIIDKYFRPERALQQLSSISGVNLYCFDKKSYLPKYNTTLEIKYLDDLKIFTSGRYKYKGINKIKWKIWRHLNKKFVGTM